jgi:hypothetical protein
MIISSGNGITINAGTEDVVILRGLTIVGQGPSYGIYFYSGKALYVENCSIKGFDYAGIDFRGPGYLLVKDTLLKESQYGIYISAASGTANAVLDRVHLERNDFGLEVASNGKVTVRDSIAANNSDTGFYVNPAIPGPGELNIESSVATGNSCGIRSRGFSNEATIRVSNSTVTDNATGLESISYGSFTGNLLSRGNNTVEGNTSNGSFTGTFTAK